MNLLIIQARMGSSRLPGKVLKKIQGKTILAILLERVLLAKRVDKVVVATTFKKIDRAIVDFCKKHKFNYFCGSEKDVLKRYYDCATKFNGNTIIRVTSDCPLVDPAVIDKTIELFYKKKVDYAANTIPPHSRKWPDGSDVEVFSMKALKKCYLRARNEQREHVTFYLWKSKPLFKIAQLKNKQDWSKYRYTIDYQEDLSRLEKIVKVLRKKNIFGNTQDIVNIINDKIEEKTIDKKFSFGYGWKK